MPVSSAIVINGVNNGVSPDIADYLVLTRLVSGEITPTSEEAVVGDLNDSGDLDTGDLILMLQLVIGEDASS